jgi:hypothetical protein
MTSHNVGDAAPLADPDPERKLYPFILLGNKLQFDNDLPQQIVISPEINIYKATSEHIKSIYHHAQLCFYTGQVKINPYETNMVSDESGNRRCVHLDDENDFHYWVVEHKNRNYEPDLEMALCLSELNLISLIHAHGLWGHSGLCNTAVVCTYIQDLDIQLENFTKITPALIDDLQQTYQDILIFNGLESSETIDIKKAIDDFIALKEISNNSQFKIVALFSILELLLTTNSKQSITVQLKSKINLVMNLMDSPIDPMKYFKSPQSIPIQTIVGKLYDFRSNIAHGNISDFNSSLQILGSKDSAQKFLNDLTRKILKFCINNTTLIIDLKKC